MAGQLVELPQSPDPKPQGTSLLPTYHLSTSTSAGPNYSENSPFWCITDQFKQLSDVSANWIAVPSFCSPKTHSTIQPLGPGEIKIKGIKHTSNKDECKNKQLDLKSSQIQMPKRQYKSKLNNRKNIMALSEPSDPMTVRPEHFSGAEA